MNQFVTFQKTKVYRWHFHALSFRSKGATCSEVSLPAGLALSACHTRKCVMAVLTVLMAVMRKEPVVSTFINFDIYFFDTTGLQIFVSRHVWLDINRCLYRFCVFGY